MGISASQIVRIMWHSNRDIPGALTGKIFEIETQDKAETAATTQKWYKHKMGSSKRKEMFLCSLPQVFPS